MSCPLCTSTSSGWIFNLYNNTSEPIIIPQPKDCCCLYYYPDQNPLPAITTLQPGEIAQFEYQCATTTSPSHYDLIFYGASLTNPTFTCDYSTLWWNCNDPSNCIVAINNSGFNLTITQNPSQYGDNYYVSISKVGQSLTGSFGITGRPQIHNSYLYLTFTTSTTFDFTFTTTEPFLVPNVYNPLEFQLGSIHLGGSISQSNLYAIELAQSEIYNQTVTGTLTLTPENNNSTGIVKISGTGLVMEDYSSTPKYETLNSPVNGATISLGSTNKSLDPIYYNFVPVFDSANDGNMSIDQDNNFTLEILFSSPFTDSFTSVSGTISLGPIGLITISESGSTASFYGLAASSVTATFNLTNGTPSGIVIRGAMPTSIPNANIYLEPLQGSYSLLFTK